MSRIYKKSKGFTLVEIIIAVFILAFLTILVVVLLDPADFFPGARDTRRISDLQAIDSALSMYRQDVGAFFKSPSIAADPSNAVIGLVRQNCAGYSNCFTSLAAWQAAFGGINFGACAQGDLVCANKVAVAKIDGAWINPDTSRLNIDGWTTSATNYIRIYTTITARHSGKWDDTKYRLAPNPAGEAVLYIRANHVRIDGLQIYAIRDGYLANGIDVYGVSNTSDVRISNNILKANFTGSGGTPDYAGIYLATNYDVVVKVWNNIVYGWRRGDILLNGIKATYGVHDWYNNTVYDSHVCYGGTTDLDRPKEGPRAKNNIAQNCTDGYSDGFNSASDYNISDIAGDAPNTIFATTSKIVSFVNVANKDFHLSPSDTAARGAGINLFNDPNLSFTDDIDSQSRGGSCNLLWDIGADQVTTLSQTVFVSVPDTSPNCSNLSLPSLSGAGWGYSCIVSSTLQKTNCSGWIPVDFTKIPGNAFSALPIDPTNSSENGQYYTFVTDGKKWELTSILESDKNKGASNIGGKDGGQYVNILEIGTNLTLTPSVVKNR